MFKENRWWWTVGVQGAAYNAGTDSKKDGKEAVSIANESEYKEDEEADEDEMQARAAEKNAVSEDFKE